MHRVLIIDHSLTVRMDLDEVFQAAGWQTLLCASASAAREAAREGFDCVILDVLLPDGNGLDLLREFKNTPATARVPVILLSTRTEVADKLKAMSIGADAYVAKPYDQRDLVSEAERLVEQARGQAPALKGATILIVEDSPTFGDSLQQSLEQAGYRTLLARTGEEGLRLAAKDIPDAAMIDSLLPDMEGTVVVHRLKAAQPVPCLLLIGSFSTPEDQARLLQGGADALARKDEGLRLILASLRTLLERAGPSPDLLAANKNLYGPKTILAVDDSATYLHALAEHLREDNYNVVLANSGPKALDLLQVQQVDCILLDFLMPGMSGQEVCRRIKASPAWRYIPVIMLTGMEASEAILECFRAGADDFVSKSSEFAILRARLRAQLRRRQFEEEMQRMLDELRKKDFALAQSTIIRESEQRMQLALQVSCSFAFEWELASDEVVRSDSCEAILGVSGEALQRDTGEHFFQRVHPEDREQLRRAIQALKPDADAYHTEYRFIRPDASIAVLEESARGFFDAEGKLCRLVGVVSDITERKKTELELANARSELERYAKELEQRVTERTAKLVETVSELEHFSYTITHDMRAPLRSMQGFGDMLLGECGDCLHPERTDYIRRIAASAARMDCLITDALNYSKAVQEEVKLEPVDVIPLLHSIVESYPQFHPPQAEVEIIEPVPVVLGNQAALTQCLSNLIGNAVKFVPPGKLPHVRLWGEIRGEYIRLWVEDNGIGIPKEYQETIWIMFQRLSKKYEGTGIGLALVRKVVERMKGKVGVESELGKGSRFWVELKAYKT